MMLSIDIFHIGFPILAPIYSLLVIFSLVKRNLKSTVSIFFSIVLFIFFSRYLTEYQLRLILVIFHVIILVLLVYDFMMIIESKKVLNLFLILLIAYEISVLYKFMARIFDIQHGIVIFYLSTFIQLFFGVLFTIFNVNTKNIPLFRKTEMSDE